MPWDPGCCLALPPLNRCGALHTPAPLSCAPTPPHPTPAAPPAGSLGATANAAALSLMYADMVERSSGSLAREYRCWGLSQVGRLQHGWAGHMQWGPLASAAALAGGRTLRLCLTSIHAALRKLN